MQVRKVLTDPKTSLAVRPDAPNLLRWLDIYLAQEISKLDADGVIARSEALRAKQLN